MQIDDYWDLVSLIDTEALLRSDGIAALQPLLDELERHTKESVFAFYKHMVKRLYALNRDDVRSKCECGHGGEGFLYHRLFVIGRGREYYSAFLERPQNLSENHMFDSMLYCLPGFDEFCSENDIGTNNPEPTE